MTRNKNTKSVNANVKDFQTENKNLKTSKIEKFNQIKCKRKIQIANTAPENLTLIFWMHGTLGLLLHHHQHRGNLQVRLHEVELNPLWPSLVQHHWLETDNSQLKSALRQKHKTTQTKRSEELNKFLKPKKPQLNQSSVKF